MKIYITFRIDAIMFDLDLRDVFQERIHGVKRELPVIPLISQNLAKLKYA
jgi:hypothetical protein